MYGQSHTYDTVIIPLHLSYAVLQTIGETTVGKIKGLYVRAHGSKLRPDGSWEQTVSNTCIPIELGKTYWFNLHHDGPGEVSKVALYDPENNYAQVGEISITESRAWGGKGACSKILFGRADKHGNINTPETFSHFSHIMVDYTEGKFPLLPGNRILDLFIVIPAVRKHNDIFGVIRTNVIFQFQICDVFHH
jgi:hypothetical protein